jgi:hypothetical protein
MYCNLDARSPTLEFINKKTSVSIWQDFSELVEMNVEDTIVILRFTTFFQGDNCNE